jgi:hypothetical protein
MPFSVYFMKTTMHALLAFSEADPKFAVCAADAVTAENATIGRSRNGA